MKKKFMYLGVLAALFVSAMGMTSFAALATFTAKDYNPTCYVALKITSGSTRYCSVYLYQSGYSDGTNLETLGSSRYSKANGGIVSVSKTPSKSYAYGTGMIYKGSKASTGVAKTFHKKIK